MYLLFDLFIFFVCVCLLIFLQLYILTTKYVVMEREGSHFLTCNIMFVQVNI